MIATKMETGNATINAKTAEQLYFHFRLYSHCRGCLM